VKIRGEAERCQGHNRCVVLAPDLFDIDDLGFAHATTLGAIAPALEAKAQLAEANCPEHAVVLED